MLGVCRRYIKDIHLSEDVMITGFVKIFSNLKNFSFQGSFEGWIRRIITNECISFLRSEKQLFYTEETYYSEEIHDEINQQFSVEEIQKLIDSLPDGYRVVFNLYVIEGYKHSEIAQMLGISEGTSKSQLSHARKLLKKQITLLNN
ncbi:DNA-directed RNA polymerase sigma-70 factor [Capnocytophaga felis]|uniref:DNA-directed RNA polymerase sigma-70 factor n=2 Tax=Capnocytophaga felis TaxID=2267611 RepID=A0A5M4B7Z3_9FLAO|nr:DNA-directed RNA polymerase sigma-70 factor [Capnocytophaga felis]GET47189.1 DNA-directed RNA polymerase sigma-70 factor [Capnocytophaga felis]